MHIWNVCSEILYTDCYIDNNFLSFMTSYVHGHTELPTCKRIPNESHSYVRYIDTFCNTHTISRGELILKIKQIRIINSRVR